jgi:hypothetical protein
VCVCVYIIVVTIMTREKKNNNGLSSAPSSLNVIIYPIVAIGGSFLGLFLVLITNRTLLEITFSPVFAVIIGLLFEALAICLLYRVVSLHVSVVCNMYTYIYFDWYRITFGILIIYTHTHTHTQL